MLFNYDTIPDFKKTLEENLNFPYKWGYFSELGGKENIAFLLTISLTSKNEWINGILENSKYIKLYISKEGSTEYISGNLKFRKTKCDNIDKLLLKLNKIREN